MKTVKIEPDFTSWRSAARALLAEKVHPRDVLWVSKSAQSDGMLMFDEPVHPTQDAPRLNVPRDFVRLAETVSCHRSGDQWALLYQILWAMTHGNDRHVMKNQTDSAVRGLEQMRKTVSRDIHKMRAFVRFRQVEDGDNGLESYVAWYEPEHLIARVNTPFFRKRFGGMNWSILTPDACVHWNGQSIHHTDGVDQSQAPEGDELEELWRGYYRSIFNPARLKIKMMQTEMPKKYWKNLPEAEIIEELIQTSGEQVMGMMQEEERSLKPAPKNDYLRHLDELNR
ncbi:MAG: TIGR03915 family putative DNA repair protein [Akkermansiaceae bacterium]